MNDLHLGHSHFKTHASNNNKTMHQNNDKNTLFGIQGNTNLLFVYKNIKTIFRDEKRTSSEVYATKCNLENCNSAIFVAPLVSSPCKYTKYNTNKILKMIKNELFWILNLNLLHMLPFQNRFNSFHWLKTLY